MRLALLSRRYPPLIGGAERVVSYLAEALAREGAQVSVLTSCSREATELPAREVVAMETKAGKKQERTAAGGSLEIIRLGTLPIRFLGTWFYMRNLRAWFARNPIDLAYVSMLKHDAHVAIGAGKALGFPVVLRPEGAGETGDIAWQQWGNFGRRIGRSCRQADAFVSISKAIEEEIRTAWTSGTLSDPNVSVRGTSEASPRIVSIPNGVPIPEIAWQVRPGWKSAPQAVFVGRLAPEKGLDVLLKSWPSVLSTFPEARLTLIGEGPERAKLEEQVRSLGLSQHVELPGIADADGVTARLQGSDLFVLPSREEGMSIALLEAMALGIPVVASSIPGNRRIVSEFKTGRLAKVDDPAALARVIVEQWSDFDRAYHISRAARARVEHEYSISAVARKHMALFRQLIDERAKRD